MSAMPGPQLTVLSVADRADAWEAAGFATQGEDVAIDAVRLRCGVAGPASGIVAWGFDAETADVIDGILTLEEPRHGLDARLHPNGVTDIDHVVMMSPDGERSIAALEAVGFAVRRTREFTRGGKEMRQTFLWMGDTILEMAWEADVHEPGPATIWGLAFSVADLDETVDFLGDRCSEPRDAVQPGRRVSTLRTKDLGISVPTLLISPHR